MPIVPCKIFYNIKSYLINKRWKYLKHAKYHKYCVDHKLEKKLARIFLNYISESWVFVRICGIFKDSLAIPVFLSEDYNKYRTNGITLKNYQHYKLRWFVHVEHIYENWMITECLYWTQSSFKTSRTSTKKGAANKNRSCLQQRTFHENNLKEMKNTCH